MTEETIAPAAIQTAETTATPEVVIPEVTADTGLEPDSTVKPEKTAEQKELEYLRRKASKADRSNARLYQENRGLEQRLTQQQQPQGQPQGQDTRDPMEIAREIAQIQRIEDKSNGVAQDGFKRYGEEAFRQKLQVVINEAGPLIDPRGRPTALGEAILEADKPAELLDYIGSDPALADSLEGLSPTQLGRRIERLEAQMNARPPKAASNAPPPIKPLGSGSTTVTNDLEKAGTMAEYKAIRAKQGARWAR